MPRPPKQTIGHFFRLRPASHDILLALADHLGISQTEVIGRALALLAEKELTPPGSRRSRPVD